MTASLTGSDALDALFVLKGNIIGIQIAPRDFKVGALPEMLDRIDRIIAAVESDKPKLDAFEQMREALRRHHIFEQEIDGKEQLEREFGAPEFPGSSLSEDAWLERVLREPAREALAAADAASTSEAVRAS